jgi:hypothetical protein
MQEWIKTNKILIDQIKKIIKINMLRYVKIMSVGTSHIGRNNMIHDGQEM